MSGDETVSGAADIPRQIIEKFLAELAAQKVSPEIVARLKKTLVERGDISEVGLKASLTASTDVHD